jgi:2-polyprenyl-3-methyl-5-hydroxy-6-metoxy-1,4-benzoquinol methylase
MTAMDAAFRARLERVYSEHPITADAVLARVRRDRGSLDGVTERDLAEARAGGVTDQNHMGGAATDRAIGSAVGIRADWNVLDVGAGLGGTARLFAEEFGCRCHGVELTTSRFEDAVRLTQLLALGDRVTFTHGDFMTVDATGAPFDLVVCQGAALHFPDLNAFVVRAAAHLRPGGWLAVEDVLLSRPPMTTAEEESLQALQRCWNIGIQSRDEWMRALEQAGFVVQQEEDLTRIAVEDLESTLREGRSRRFEGASPDERFGWEVGLACLRSGLISAVRILSRCSKPM